MLLPDQDVVDARSRFQTINLLRPLLTGVPAFFAFQAGEWILTSIMLAFIAAGLVWFALSTWVLSVEQQSSRLSFLPTFIDVSFLTAFIYFTGGSLSTIIMAYAYATALCSMNSKANQGLFAAAYISLAFALMNTAIYLGWLQPRNVMGPVRVLSTAETVQVVILTALVNFAVYGLIRALVRSLEAKNRALEEQSARVLETNRSLSKAHLRFKNEMSIARRIQEALIPRNTPAGESFRIDSRYISLDEIGGDYLDYFVSREGDPGILVADAAGHGVPAALVACMTKIAADRYRSQNRNPRNMLASLNRSLLDKTSMHFVAATYATYTVATRTLKYCIAGNPPLYLLQPGKPARQLEGRGSVLGIRDDPKLETCEVLLEPGDSVVIFTDGINECRNAEGKELGPEELESLLTSVVAQGPSRNMAEQIVQELESFTGPGGFEDDVTLVVLSVR